MFTFFLLVLSRFFAKNGWQRRKKRLQSRQLNSHPCGADTIRKGSLTESGGRCNRRRWNCVITTVTRDTSACTQQVNKADDNLSSIKVEPRKWFFRPYVRVIYARRKDVFFVATCRKIRNCTKPAFLKTTKYRQMVCKRKSALTSRFSVVPAYLSQIVVTKNIISKTNRRKLTW